MIASRLVFLTAAFAGLLAAPVHAQDAPAQTDAEPGYWTNLFENTIHYTISQRGVRDEVDVHFNRDGSVSSPAGHSGQWRVEGESGSEQFCYNLTGFETGAAELTQCFDLRRMNRPRIGARWGGEFDQGHRYVAVVVEGRQLAAASP